MSLVLFANNASTTLAAAITSSATSVSVSSGQGALFPNPQSGQYFRATLVKNGSPGTFEIVKVTAASGDTFTIARAQEGTTAQAWSVGDYFNLFLTAADLSAFAQFDDLQSQAGNYAADTGVANANVVALTPALTQHIVGMPIRWKAAQSNTGASTFSDGVGALANVTPEGAALVQGDIVAGGIYVTVYDGTRFQTVTLHRTNFSQLSGQATAAQVPALSALSGAVTAGQVPLGAVSQYQYSLSFNGSQVAGAVSEANKLYLTSGNYVTFNWAGQSGQPSYLFGSNDGANVYVWNPVNFSVANASTLGGYSASASAYASTVVLRDGSGYVWATYFNQSSPKNENTAVNQVATNNGSDGFIRWGGAAFVLGQMVGAYGASALLSALVSAYGAASLLELLMTSGAVTLQADPGGTPANGAPGSIVWYY